MAENRRHYVITALNRLSGRREEIGRPMTEEDAQNRLATEKKERRYKRFQPYTRLKVERVQKKELTLKFEIHE